MIRRLKETSTEGFGPHQRAPQRLKLGLLIVLTGVCICARPPPARAWGDEGHRIIGLIAEHYLAPAVRARVEALLAGDTSALVPDSSIASEATWADRYRDSDRDDSRVRYEHTYRWHFIDLDLRRPDLDRACFSHPPLPPGVAASAGPAEDCVVDKIDQFEAELAAAATPVTERRIALQYLLHLVGDLHQPLHACTNHDAGGNRTRVSARGHEPGSLHRYWDVDLVQALGEDPQSVATALIARIRRSDLAAWRRGDTATWALESHQLAVAVAYGGLPERPYRGRYQLSSQYLSAGSTVVATQLSRAGVRLALLLNRALQ